MTADYIEVLSQDNAGRQCNPVTNRRRVGGRRRDSISYDNRVEPPNETMLILAGMKNEGHSWRTLADEINYHITDGRVSHSLVRRVALGLCNSPRIDYALGIRQAPPPIEVTPCPDCGKLHKQVKECKPRRPPKGKVRLSLWVTEDERDIIRAAWDSHPGGRVAWQLEHIKE